MKIVRKHIHEAIPNVIEEWKWETPVFSQNGSICALGAFKDHVKINFFKGASLDDPHKLFNAGLEAKTSRSIDLYEGDTIDKVHLKELLQQAVKFNSSKKK
jgi:hypothetical protein